MHFWRPRVKSNDNSQILPKDALCDWNQYSRKKLTIFFGNLAVSGHSKSQKLSFKSNFKIDSKYANHISKLSFWHQLFRKLCVKVIQAHLRSKIALKGSNITLFHK